MPWLPHPQPRTLWPAVHACGYKAGVVFGAALNRVLAFRLLAPFDAGLLETKFRHPTRESGKRLYPFGFKLLRSQYLFLGVLPQSFALFLPVTERAAHRVNDNFVRREPVRVISN